MKFYDLFGGIGGFRLGLEQANRGNSGNGQEDICIPGGCKKEYSAGIGNSQAKRPDQCIDGGAHSKGNRWFECVGYCDFDKHAVKCYNANFKEHHEPTDARKVGEADLPEFDLLCAGFPCQPFSLAGKRQAFEDERGTLFHEIVRIVEIRRPAHLLLENVKGLLSAQEGYCFAFILSRLEALGYYIEWEVLNSKYFGVPQNRERVFIHCFREGSRHEIFPIGQGDCLLGSQEGADEGRAQAKPCATTCRPGKLKGDSTYILIDAYNASIITDDCATTLRTNYHNGNTQIGFGKKIRNLTPLECERIQGFPDGWTSMLPESRRYKALGNAVTVNVIQAIGARLKEVSCNA